MMYPIFVPKDYVLDIQTWIQALPKAEHHLHIEGTVLWDMAREASDEVLPEQAEWAAAHFKFDDFTDFEEAMRRSYRPVLVELEGYHKTARHHFQILAEQNVRYVETSFAVAVAMKRGYPYADVVRAIVRAAPPTMTVRVFAGFNRDGIFPDEVLQDILNTPDLAGIDLHGDERLEANFEHFSEIYDEARRLGLRTKAHAGELRDSSSVKEIMEKLRPQRIQHGVTSAKDAKMLALLAEQDVVLDMCPTSNVKLQVVPDIHSYPLRVFLEHDIELTINTDDPAIFDCSLSGELLGLYQHKLLSPQEIVKLQEMAFARADIDDKTRRSIKTELSSCMAELKL